MPIRKFRAPPEEDESVWISPGDPALWQTIGAVWELARRLCPPCFPPGVYKHRSIEAANRLTEEWERNTVRRQAERRERDAQVGSDTLLK